MIISKEFFIKHGLYDKEFFSYNKLSNFINFIKRGDRDTLRINPTKSLKDIIIDIALNQSNYNLNVSNDNSEVVNIENSNKIQTNQKHSKNYITDYISEQNQNIKDSNEILNIKNFENCNSNDKANISQNNLNNQSNISNNLYRSNLNFYNNNKLVNSYSSAIDHFNSYSNKNIYSNNVNHFDSQKFINKPSTSQGIKYNKNNIFSINDRNKYFTNIRSITSKVNNANSPPILNEKIYKIEYNNPQAVIENLEPEIAKIKGLSINKSKPKIPIKNYTKAINNLKKSKKNLISQVTTSGQLPEGDLEQIKKKNKLLEYIVLQRSKNRLKLENDKKFLI